MQEETIFFFQSVYEDMCYGTGLYNHTTALFWIAVEQISCT